MFAWKISVIRLHFLKFALQNYGSSKPDRFKEIISAGVSISKSSRVRPGLKMIE